MICEILGYAIGECDWVRQRGVVSQLVPLLLPQTFVPAADGRASLPGRQLHAAVLGQLQEGA